MARRDVKEEKFLEVLRPANLVYTIVSNKRPLLKQVSAAEAILWTTQMNHNLCTHIYTPSPHTHTHIVATVTWMEVGGVKTAMA